MTAPAPPAGCVWPEAASVRVVADDGAKLVWLLHVDPDGRRQAIPFGRIAAQMLAAELAEAGRGALEGRTG